MEAGTEVAVGVGSVQEVESGERGGEVRRREFDAGVETVAVNSSLSDITADKLLFVGNVSERLHFSVDDRTSALLLMLIF